MCIYFCFIVTSSVPGRMFTDRIKARMMAKEDQHKKSGGQPNCTKIGRLLGRSRQFVATALAAPSDYSAQG